MRGSKVSRNEVPFVGEWIRKEISPPLWMGGASEYAVKIERNLVVLKVPRL
jgi:hypothetical protein